jgi:hypothetical protein
MKAPARDPGDFGIALRAESTLFMPEMAKSAGTPKRFQHVSPFPFLEVGLPSSQPPLLGPALSEPDVTVSRHPAQTLRTPLSGRRGSGTERCKR